MNRPPEPAATALALEVDREDEDPVCGILWSLGTLGIQLGDGAEGGNPMAITAHFPDADTARRAADRIHGLGYRAELRRIDPDEYSDRWRLHARTERIGSAIVLHPPWERPEPDHSDQLMLEIEPGRAFGSGSHPTTRLCLRLLVDHPPEPGCPPRVLDVGTGTGVLAVAAARLGAESVTVTETDPGVHATWELNAERNRVSHLIAPGDPDLSTHTDGYGLVMANLLLPTLRDLSEDLIRLITPRGRLIVSGVLVHQVDELLGVFGGLIPVDTVQEDGWVALCLKPEDR